MASFGPGWLVARLAAGTSLWKGLECDPVRAPGPAAQKADLCQWVSAATGGLVCWAPSKGNGQLMLQRLHCPVAFGRGCLKTAGGEDRRMPALLVDLPLMGRW